MSVWEILGYVGLGFLPAGLLIDLAYRARKFDSTRFWRLRAFIVTVMAFTFSFWLAGFWAETLTTSVLDLSSLGTWAGAGVGILAYNFCHYWYHRLAHKSDVLWRVAHQMHHSAESLDVFGAFYLSPVDVFAFTTLGSVIAVPLLGLTVEAATLVGFFGAFNAVFQHMNIRTPRWVGYLVQRPESHAIHHQRGVHGNNYADLPLMDMIFGTFKNPAEFDAECGFYKGASARIPEMLAFQDVSEPRAVRRAKVLAARRDEDTAVRVA